MIINTKRTLNKLGASKFAVILNDQVDQDQKVFSSG